MQEGLVRSIGGKSNMLYERCVADDREVNRLQYRMLRLLDPKIGAGYYKSIPKKDIIVYSCSCYCKSKLLIRGGCVI